MIEGSPSNDDEAGRNRKPRSARTPAERLQAVQEKNRRAQKRFRERQKVHAWLISICASLMGY